MDNFLIYFLAKAEEKDKTLLIMIIR